MKIILSDGTVTECAAEDELHVLRHSCAHLMAQAIMHLYPQAKFAYGPANEKGFYYDVDFGDNAPTEEDLPAIEAEMKKNRKREPSDPSVHPSQGRGDRADEERRAGL